MSRAELADGTLVRRGAHRFLRADRRIDADLLDQLWEAPTKLLVGSKDLRVGPARRTVSFSWAGSSYVLKWFGSKNARHAGKRLFQRSEADVAYHTSHRLADAGIATPRAIAYVENRWGLLRRHSGLLYPFVKGEVLRERIKSIAASGDLAMFGPLEADLKRLWSRLDSAKVSLGDSNSGNFVVSKDNRFWVVDLDRVRFHLAKPVARFRQQVKWRQLRRNIRRITGDAWQTAESWES